MRIQIETLLIVKIPKLPDVPESDRTSLVTQLLEVLHYQTEVIQALRDEVAQLKGEKGKPTIKPSQLDKKTTNESDEEDKKSDKKRAGSDKRKKTAQLDIHETKKIVAENVPLGSTFKGYKTYVVQGLVIQSHNIEYQIERWQTPEGTYVEGQLPACVKGHFDTELVSFILYQYHQCHVTQPLLLEQLREYGVDISSGQLNRLLMEGYDDFHSEKEELLSTGLEISPYIQVDDTGARHQGHNGVCTHIGNDLFAWFKSTGSKSRINFLTLLRAGDTHYHVTEAALSYMKAQGLAATPLNALCDADECVLADEVAWVKHLNSLEIIRPRHVRIATEGALLGCLVAQGIPPDLVILSDDAGQFNVLLHALCWVHAERTIHKIIPFNDAQKVAVDTIRQQIWDLYKALKADKQHPCPQSKARIIRWFDELFQTKTCYMTLNLALRRLYQNKRELLLVLERPEIPLHNNASESDIREYAKRRKVSGGTRSEAGRKSRDTFISLKKTCRKLGISFWFYLKDRRSGTNKIPRLSDLMRHKALEPI